MHYMCRSNGVIYVADACEIHMFYIKTHKHTIMDYRYGTTSHVIVKTNLGKVFWGLS